MTSSHTNIRCLWKTTDFYHEPQSFESVLHTGEGEFWASGVQHSFPRHQQIRPTSGTTQWCCLRIWVSSTVVFSSSADVTLHMSRSSITGNRKIVSPAFQHTIIIIYNRSWREDVPALGSAANSVLFLMILQSKCSSHRDWEWKHPSEDPDALDSWTQSIYL